MSAISPFSEAKAYTPQSWLTCGDVRMAAGFAALAEEYQEARQKTVMFDRSDRGLLILTGTDRQGWLHNLVTNTVTTLTENGGNYAFAVNVKGRILFDVNVLCVRDALWLDLAAAAVARAAAHFDRYLFREDVRIVNASGQYARLGCCGPQARDLARQLEVTNFMALPALESVSLADGEARLVRHDFAGQPGFELIVPRGRAAVWWDRLAAGGVRPAGYRTLDVLRIEAGIPWLGRDMDEHVLPPETGQAERGISYHKGCYLGQEIMERLRAHGVLTKRLVQLRVADGTGVELPATMRRDNLDVGRITSLVAHPREPYWVGLGYVKTAVTGFADITVGDPPRAVTICSA
jgi:folate-binding protein YgfZ